MEDDEVQLLEETELDEETNGRDDVTVENDMTTMQRYCHPTVWGKQFITMYSQSHDLTVWFTEYFCRVIILWLLN